jgi:FtsP/CotA-like multicopper oxidase with cupredoxin domain
MRRTSLPQTTRRAVCLGLAASIVCLHRAAAQQSDHWTTLVATPRTMHLRPDAAAAAELWTFSGRAPGTTIRIVAGEPLRLRIENQTGARLSFHVLGLRGPNAMDGAGGLTQEPTAPGGTFEIAVPDPRPGTYLIRPLVLGASAEPTERGLATMLVVEERKPPVVDQEIEMLVDDWRLAEDGSLAPFGATPEAATGGRLGTWLTVGGEAVPRPIAALPGARLRVRLANASNARVMPLRFEGVRAYVAAIDSVPTDTFEPLRATLPFPPGRRYDLIVEMPGEGEAAGRILAAIGPGVPLATLTPTGKTVIGTRPPVTGIEERPSLPAEIRLQNATRRDLILGGGARRGPDGQVRYEGDPTRIWTVNGVAGTPGMPPLMKVARGTPVVLAIKNDTPAVQALHLHGHVFRLLHNLDDGWEPYWLDTLQVPEGRTSRIAFIADNPGKWLFGATMLERLDTGLWTWIEVG